MDVKSISKIAITTMITIVVLVSVFVPAIANSQDSLYEKKVNTGTIRLNLVNEEEHTGTITLVDSTPQFTIDDKIVNRIDGTKRCAGAIGNNFMIGSSASNIVLDYWDGTNAAHITSGVQTASFDIHEDNTVTLKYTVSDVETTVNVPENDWIFVANNNGKYVESDQYYGGSSYVTNLDQLYSGSWTFVNGYQFGMHNTDVTVNGNTIDDSNVTIDTEEEDGFTKINYSYTDSKTYFTFDVNDTTNTVNVFVVIVPTEVQYLPSENNSIFNLFGVLVTIMTVVVLMGVVVILFRSRQ